MIKISTLAVILGVMILSVVIYADEAYAGGLVKRAISTADTWLVSDIPDLPASKITSGTFAKSMISTTDTWTAAEIPSLDTSKLTTGTMATARLGSGTADSTTFLRGDQTWTKPLEEKLVDTTLGANAASIGGSWSGSYEKLEIILLSRGGSAAGIPYVRFNGDSGAASYAWNDFGITGTAVVDAQDSSDSEIQLTGTAADTDPSIITLDVMNFATSRKAVSADVTRVDPIGTNIAHWTAGGHWSDSANSITQVDFPRSAGNWLSGTRLIVIGIQ